MNKYEEKFKSQWEQNQVRTARLTNEVKQYEEDLAKIVQDIEAIDKAKDLLKESGVSNEAVQALKDKVAALHQTRRNREDNLTRAKNSLTDTRKMRTILQDLCPHENTVYESTDYHKREDFYDCVLCGKNI